MREIRPPGMAATPSQRLKLRSSNPTLFSAFSKSSGRAQFYEKRLFLKRVIGHTCVSPAAFDSSGSLFAYVAGGAVVVVDVGPEGTQPTQRFFRARPNAVPLFTATGSPRNSPTSTPKLADGRAVSMFGSPDLSDLSSTPKTWTSRERIKAATCVSLSERGKFLAVGETGYAPRVLIFSLRETSSDQPLVALSEHDFGVRAVAWSKDGLWLASLGTAEDGFLFIWKIDPRTGSARLFQQNRCISYVAGMIWLGSQLITFGLRHVKAWKVADEAQRSETSSKKYLVAKSPNLQGAQKTLPGRNVLLGPLLEANFTCAAPLDEHHALLCSESGDVCILDDRSGLVKLTQITNLGFHVTSCAIHQHFALAGGVNGQSVRLDISNLLGLNIIKETTIFRKASSAVHAMGHVHDRLVTVDSDGSIDIWHAGGLPESCNETSGRLRLLGHHGPVLGVQPLEGTGASGPAFITWSGSGKVLLWDLRGEIQDSLDVDIDEEYTGDETDPINKLCVVGSDKDATIIATGDGVGVLRVVERNTGTLLLKIKAHASKITNIAVHHDASKTLIATSGRDRTVQLFLRAAGRAFGLIQTLDFPARVTHLTISQDDRLITCSMDRSIQIHRLAQKEGEPSNFAAVPFRSITLKACPTSLVLEPDSKTAFVSSLDRSVYSFDLQTGRQLNAFKCLDENADTAAVDLVALRSSQGQQPSPSLLLGLSNTDKSVRVYDARTGAFVDREWGHTESINGVALVQDRQCSSHKVVSVGCDGTVMIFDLEAPEPEQGSASRSPSPTKAKGFASITKQPPVRRVLSKAELSGFSHSSTSDREGRRTPLKMLRTRKTKSNDSSPSAPERPKTAYASTVSSSTKANHQRKTSSPSPSRTLRTSPGVGPKRVNKRPSLPVLSSNRRSSVAQRESVAREGLVATSRLSRRGDEYQGSLQTASEQTCRQLRAYRSKLSSGNRDAITPDVLAELEAELRLTLVALSDRAAHSRTPVAEPKPEPFVNHLLDQYSERLVSMLDDKLRLRLEGRLEGNGGDGLTEQGCLALMRLATSADVGRPQSS